MIATKDGPKTGKRQECRAMRTKKGSQEDKVSENGIVRVCVCVRVKVFVCVCAGERVIGPILRTAGATGTLSKARQHLLEFTIRLLLWEC